MKIGNVKVTVEQHVVYVWQSKGCTWRFYASTGRVTKNDVMGRCVSVAQYSLKEIILFSLMDDADEYFAIGNPTDRRFES